jgi:hypothetical protein
MSCDLVKKQGALVCKLKEACLPFTPCARECAAFVPEELALHQLFREGGDVMGDKGPISHRRGVMDSMSEELFARTRLSLDKNIGA